MIKELIRFANYLDQKGLVKEANIVDNIVKTALTPDQLAPDLAPSSSNYMQGAPDDAAKTLRNTMIGGLPVIGTAYDIVSISLGMGELATELAKPNPDKKVISEICKGLAADGGLLLISAIPFGRIARGAKVLKTSPKAIKLVKKSPVTKNTTAADVDSWDWDEIMDMAESDQNLYRATRPDMPKGYGFTGLSDEGQGLFRVNENARRNAGPELTDEQADALFEEIMSHFPSGK